MNCPLARGVRALVVVVIAASASMEARRAPLAPVGTWVQDGYASVPIVRRRLACPATTRHGLTECAFLGFDLAAASD